MKNTVIVILITLISTACSAPPTNRESTTSTSTNKAAETTAAAPLTEAEATAKEKEIWAAFEKKDYDAFAAMLADDSIYVSSDGVNDKAATVKGVSGFVPTDVVFSDWRFIPVDKDAVAIAYTVKAKGTMNGQSLPETSVHASSVYVNRGGKWLAIYHQDCEVKTTPPPPPAKAPKPTASPTAFASPVATTSDVVANEKAVWASLTAGQFDVFESFLASDFIEIEPFGVTDRAGSVKGVQAFDFSKSSLSDWKTVRINDNASIVTYTAHFPGQKPDTEYHSTVWANRNGKWVGVLHHGTHKTAQAPTPTKEAQK